ncbi:hypothetical protein E7T06_16465 [Deinococcus sp. Arct2-2]|uniref:hypothetical protein n=1 Tax=Deinococcus sp. Arct2-2 TaxID=2568653 RepID=UPI0010A2EB7C|nr:hypothetical protein [Deinococcus sp. Arct2-2]THF68422.1 hypothetical protein E7T06_16465 [Deinococcus sp. Arct2-2]
MKPFFYFLLSGVLCSGSGSAASTLEQAQVRAATCAYALMKLSYGYKGFPKVTKRSQISLNSTRSDTDYTSQIIFSDFKNLSYTVNVAIDNTRWVAIAAYWPLKQVEAQFYLSDSFSKNSIIALDNRSMIYLGACRRAITGFFGMNSELPDIFSCNSPSILGKDTIDYTYTPRTEIIFDPKPDYFNHIIRIQTQDNRWFVSSVIKASTGHYLNVVQQSK